MIRFRQWPERRQLCGNAFGSATGSRAKMTRHVTCSFASKPDRRRDPREGYLQPQGASRRHTRRSTRPMAPPPPAAGHWKKAFLPGEPVAPVNRPSDPQRDSYGGLNGRPGQGGGGGGPGWVVRGPSREQEEEAEKGKDTGKEKAGKSPKVWQRDAKKPTFARVYVGNGNSLELVSQQVTVTIEGPRAAHPGRSHLPQSAWPPARRHL